MKTHWYKRVPILLLVVLLLDACSDRGKPAPYKIEAECAVTAAQAEAAPECAPFVTKPGPDACGCTLDRVMRELPAAVHITTVVPISACDDIRGAPCGTVRLLVITQREE